MESQLRAKTTLGICVRKKVNGVDMHKVQHCAMERCLLAITNGGG